MESKEKWARNHLALEIATPATGPQGKRKGNAEWKLFIELCDWTSKVSWEHI